MDPLIKQMNQINKREGMAIGFILGFILAAVIACAIFYFNPLNF